MTWLEFDNATGATTPIGDVVQTGEPRATLPGGLGGSREYVAVAIRSHHADHAVWQNPVTVFFRRDGAAWRTVGLERAQ